MNPPTPLSTLAERNQPHLDILCASIAESTQSLSGIVNRLREKNPGFPAIATIYRLLRDDENFADQYARAKADQSDLLVDQMLDICDDDSGDEMGNTNVQRAKLKVETRKWIASKLKPKIYGDRGDRLAVAIQISTDSSPIDLSRYG